MSEHWKSQSANSATRDEKVNEDLTGRDRLISNVIFSWAGHFVFIVAGFILPRMIDRRLGQDLLGVWDFAWSIVSYFNLIDLGVGGSVSRYVARFRMAGDADGVNRTVSSASFILSIAGMLVVGVTAVVSLLLPSLFGTKLGENVNEAQWVVLYLGASIGIQIALGAFGGVLQGCHQWKLLNLITSVGHAVIIVGMIIILVIGGRLRIISLTFLIGDTLSRLTRIFLAYRVCVGLQLQLSMIGWKMIKELYVFGGKSLIPILSKMLLSQTTSVLIVAYLGPAALALYSRPFSLIRHIEQLIQKIAAVVRPTASSLQSTDDMQGISILLQKSVRYSFYIVLPMVLTLSFFGDAILQFWMGPRYANLKVPAILAIGSLAYLGQSPAFQILAGLNAHGRAGLAQLITSIFSVVLVVLVLGFLKWGLVGVALAITVPITLMNLIYLPQLVCRKVGLNLGDYALSVITGPLIYVLPFVICLTFSRIVFHRNILLGLLCGGLSGGAVLCVVYYLYVMPERIKKRMIRLVTLIGTAT